MKSEFQFKIVPSGRVSSTVETLAEKRETDLRWIFRCPHHGRGQDTSRIYHLWIAYSTELDDAFVRRFREKASSNTRLLVFNEGQSSDTVASRLTNLQLRSPHRFYVADLFFGSGSYTTETEHASIFLERLASILATEDNPDRVFDAKVEGDTLRVIAPDFRRLEVPVSKIPSFENANPAMIEEFEIDKDGSFIYWPRLDVHLGWEQLEQIVNPEAVLKARQKAQDFNIRYGDAVRRMREQAGIRYSDVAGLSEKQLRRLEKGECRLTSNAAEALAAAHGLTANEYLNSLAKALR